MKTNKPKLICYKCSLTVRRLIGHSLNPVLGKCFNCGAKLLSDRYFVGDKYPKSIGEK